MFTANQPRVSRKGHYSCDFCRSRKLRCDRPIPCTNCVSRGKECSFAPAPARRVRRQPAGDETAEAAALPPLGVQEAQPESLHGQTPPGPQLAPGQEDLLAEIQALKKLAQDLENRVVSNAGRPPGQQADQQSSWQAHDNQVATLTPSASNPTPDPVWTNTGTPSSRLGQVVDVVAHLERVSRSHCSQGPIYVDNILFRIERIQAIPELPTYTMHLGKPTRCIYLPRHDEAKVLAAEFLSKINYIYHVVHHPTLLSTVDDTYRQINGLETLKPGNLVLLLSVIASATHIWSARDDGERPALFSSSAEAHAQAPLWIKATHDVLDAEQNCPPLALEAVQGIVILSFITCNIEGVSLRYRALLSTGLLLGRELGLHRIDGESTVSEASVVQAEMGRRAWWYLVATDWLLASRYGGPSEGVYLIHPRQMVINKPRNINDVDLRVDGPNLDLPSSECTDMSYFLQRVRLAEVSRNIVDHNSMAMKTSSRSSYHSHVMSLDFELFQMIRDIPPFFNLENYGETPLPEEYGMFIQAYLLNSMIQTQRCIIHLDYLISGPRHNPSYVSSRETCIEAARKILRAERQLLRTQHPFVQTRVRLAAILHGVFMASIVLLMDACVNGTGGEAGGVRDEVAEALRIVEDAKDHSLAAVKLHESLMQVLAKNRALQAAAQRGQPDVGGNLPASSAQITAPVVMSDGLDGPYAGQTPTSASGAPGETVNGTLPIDSGNAAWSQSDQLGQSLEELMDMDGFQWDDLFSTIDMSSFF